MILIKHISLSSALTATSSHCPRHHCHIKHHSQAYHCQVSLVSVKYITVNHLSSCHVALIIYVAGWVNCCHILDWSYCFCCTLAQIYFRDSLLLIMLSHQSVCSSKYQRSAHIKCLFISSRFTHNITVWSSDQGLLKSNLLGSRWGHRFQWGSNFQVTDLLKLQYAVPVSVSWERSKLYSNFNMQLWSLQERGSMHHSMVCFSKSSLQILKYNSH